jgi:excisionase family DNA binding protein
VWFTLLPDGNVRPAYQERDGVDAVQSPTDGGGLKQERGYGMRQVYTTGQAAKLLCVAPRTVCKWFDAGHLRGYRIPGSQDRRIPQESLVAFITEHGLALPAELTEGQTEEVQD